MDGYLGGVACLGVIALAVWVWFSRAADQEEQAARDRRHAHYERWTRKIAQKVWVREPDEEPAPLRDPAYRAILRGPWPGHETEEDEGCA